MVTVATTDSLYTGTSLIVCCGAGGVGKTSSAAALGIQAAQRGRRVCVLTIDPAKRLAQALGMSQLGNEPVAVDVPGGGQLHALMLDAKATFDRMVQETIKTDALQRALQSNHVYKLLTQAFHGMQEYMAVERLFSLLKDPRFDLVVLDTPPTTNVLGFFDAPERLSRFFDKRVVKFFLPEQGGRLSRLLSGQSAVTLIIGKVAGEDFARDLQEFFVLLGHLTEALSQRASELRGLLAQRSTRYVVVTGPERSRVDETMMLVDTLKARAYPPAAVIVNRVTPEALSLHDGSVLEEPASLDADGRSVFATLKTKIDAQRSALTRRAVLEAAQIARLKIFVGEKIVQVVPRLDVELDSVAGLLHLAEAL
jgi:anion-transporting  ArsA/GET3 family ATPase